MEKVLDKDIGVHFYEGPDDENGYIHAVAKGGTHIPFKSERIASFVVKGQDMIEFTLFEALKDDPDPDEVTRDYRQAATLVFRLDKKVRKDKEVSFEISIDRMGKLSLRLLGDSGQVKALQLTDVSAVDEIEELSTRIHEVLKDVRCASADGSAKWSRDHDMRDDEEGKEKRLHKWIVMNDKVLEGLKENRDAEDRQGRRYSLPKGRTDAAKDKMDAELMLKRMDGLILQGLDHAKEQRRRKLERAHTKA
ncbi:MAG: hypothetical protein II718_08830 [Clostridiales bacterium]|nr:hypothetical protein [Clostridiales bacterium]